MAVKLFVGGLSFSTSNERLREAFAAVGSVESASVGTDRDTGRSRGFGVVEMATPEGAEQAISPLKGPNPDSPPLGGGRAWGTRVDRFRRRGAPDGGAPLRRGRLMRERAVSVAHPHTSVDSWPAGPAGKSVGLPLVRPRHVSIPIGRR